MSSTDYVAASELKAYIGLTLVTTDDQIAAACTAASREVDGHCRRRFYADAAASARLFYRVDNHSARIDDCIAGSITSVQFDTGTDQTWAKTLTSAEWLPLPLNGVGDSGEPWPVTKIRTAGELLIPTDTTANMPTVKVTARWGWPSVPQPVKQATLILAAEIYKLREAPFGVAGFDQYGAVRIRSLPQVERMLAPYTLFEAGIA